jgi:hypothetical protein
MKKTTTLAEFNGKYENKKKHLRMVFGKKLERKDKIATVCKITGWSFIDQ